MKRTSWKKWFANQRAPLIPDRAHFQTAVRIDWLLGQLNGGKI